VLEIDGKEVARQSMEHTIPLTMQWDEKFDIGADTGTPVADDDPVHSASPASSTSRR
jgi:hypothetical protein